MDIWKKLAKVREKDGTRRTIIYNDGQRCLLRVFDITVFFSFLGRHFRENCVWVRYTTKWPGWQRRAFTRTYFLARCLDFPCSDSQSLEHCCHITFGTDAFIRPRNNWENRSLARYQKFDVACLILSPCKWGFRMDDVTNYTARAKFVGLPQCWIKD